MTAAPQLNLFDQEARKTVDPFAGISYRIRQTLDCVVIAEQEIEAAGLTREQSLAVFGALFPTGPVRGKAPDVYRHHARELINRFRAGVDLEPATDAELLCIACATSAIAPLSATGQPVAEYLFERVFPEKSKELLKDRAREKWSGQVAADVAALRKKFRQERSAA